MTEQRAREALDAQGFTNPGPKLIELVTDAIARHEEDTPAGERIHQFDYAELLADTPELLDRTEGPMTNPGGATSDVIADVITRALDYVFDDDDDDEDEDA